MELVRDGDYRNEATFCSIICDHEFTIYLTDVVAVIDLETEPEVFVENYKSYLKDHESDGVSGNSLGAYQGEVVEELPECSATEGLYPGVGCEGRRRSRISGF